MRARIDAGDYGTPINQLKVAIRENKNDDNYNFLLN